MGSLRQDIPVIQMTEALQRHREFDRFIFDEADDCILHYGSLFNEETKLIDGFWDLLRKNSVILTGTMNKSMEDLVFQAYDIRKDRFFSYEKLLNKQES